MSEIAFYILFLVSILQVAVAAPLPLIVTRVHTANPVTVTNTYVTGTTTVNLPPVEILISNGATYTFTLSDQPGTFPQVTFTSLIKGAVPTEQATTTPAATTPTATTPAATTPTATTPAATTTGATTSIATSEADEAATSTSSSTTQADTVATSSTTAATTSSSTTSAEGPTTSATTQTTNTDGDDATTSSAGSSPSSTDATATSDGSISAPTAIVYSPYQDDGSCKDYDTISSDLNKISGKGISKLRIYGTDCNLYSATLPIAKDLGMTVNQGFWISDAGVDSIDSSVSELIQWAETNGWDIFDFITIGNEAINSNYCTVSDLISKINSVKTKLTDAGYSGKVTTSEPPATFINNPSLCTDSNIDFVGVNPHSYFNENLYASDAGSYIVEQQGEVQKVCSKDVLITETGYPSKGDVNGNNVPSEANQAAAISSIIEATGGDVTILTTYNDFWKSPGPYGIEQYFGAIQLFK